MQKGVVRKHRPGQVSEYGKQLREKQELKEQYNLREKQFKKYVQSTGSPELLLRALETRLDSFVFRMGMAQTHRQAKQMVSHGHFLVNGKKITIPSYAVKMGGVVSVRPESQKKSLLQHASLSLKNYEPPAWLLLDKEKLQATMKKEPTLKEVAPTVELPLVFEFYSR
ncbi:30S ribosomal protein S4 [Patescibacteria group bacterium]|nr:30S ribosomal protein S4 [Patescibacteria group bacterium]